MIRDNPGTHHRHSTRLPGYDYAQPGAYFVTICTQGRECVLGEVVDGRMILSPFGEVVDECWRDLPSHFPGILLDQFTTMPNHVHGILVLVGATHASPLPAATPTSPLPAATSMSPLPAAMSMSPLPAATPAHGPRPRSVGAIVGSFKSATTRRVNRIRGTPGASFWQRGYYEHVIRDEGDLETIRTYVAQNPLSWELDEDCPNRLLARD